MGGKIRIYIDWSCLLVINNRQDCVTVCRVCACVCMEVFILKHEQVSDEEKFVVRKMDNKMNSHVHTCYSVHSSTFQSAPISCIPLEILFICTHFQALNDDLSSCVRSLFSHLSSWVLTRWRRQIIYGFEWMYNGWLFSVRNGIFTRFINVKKAEIYREGVPINTCINTTIWTYQKHSIMCREIAETRISRCDIFLERGSIHYINDLLLQFYGFQLVLGILCKAFEMQFHY